ncbi:MAG: ChuX/HutX family heme-like substrate-binding protein [Planctomycetota bacterium]
MMVLYRLACLVSFVALVGGCAVTEPDERDTARVRAAVADSGAISISDLASDLGISEVAVVRALPESMRVELPADDLAGTLEAVCAIRPARLIFRGRADSSQVVAEYNMGVTMLTDDEVVLAGENGFPQYHLNPADLVSVWMCRGELFGPAGRALFFYDSAGDPIMQWQATEHASSISGYDALWSRHQE